MNQNNKSSQNSTLIINSESSIFKYAYGLFYGASAAMIYVGLKRFGVAGGLPLFAIACGFLFLLYFFFAPFKVVFGLLKLANVLRGVLFGVAQVCLLQAQSNHQTSTVFISAVVASATTSFISHWALKEIRTKDESIGILLCIVGLFLGGYAVSLNLWALAGGITQGLTAVVARSMMRARLSILEAISSGFFWGCVFGLGVLLIGKKLDTVYDVSIIFVALTAVSILVLQYAFFFLYKIMSAQKAAILSLSRIPSSIALETLFLRSLPTSGHMIAAIMVLIGSLISLKNTRIEKL